MSWTNGIPSREEYTMHHLGTFPLYEALSPETAARAVKRTAPMLSRLLLLQDEPWASGLYDGLKDVVNEMADLQVELYANGVFTTAIIRVKHFVGVGNTRRADKDEPDQRFASHLATRRAYQSLMQQVDSHMRDTDLGRASLALLDAIDAGVFADQWKRSPDSVRSAYWTAPVKDESDCPETGLVARPEGFDPKKREPVGYSAKELSDINDIPF